MDASATELPTAADLARLLRSHELGAVEVVEAHLRRIETVNPVINAVVALDAERALAAAREVDAGRGPSGPLRGVPFTVKDNLEAEGLPMAIGDPERAGVVADADATVVRRMREAGAILLGKTNCPPYGGGIETDNPVYGRTANPYDPARTPGGSSGGEAAIVGAAGSPLGLGTDSGGSVRLPAHFCGLASIKPTSGLVPVTGVIDDLGQIGALGDPRTQVGPLARTVADVALFFSTIVGPHAPDPLSIDADGARFRAPLGRSLRGTRIAWFKDLGGVPFEPEILRVVNAHRQTFADLGCTVEEDEPDFSGVDEAFKTIRHTAYHANYAKLARDNPGLVKDTIKWEIAEAERNTGADVGRALARQSKMYLDTARFFEKHDYFVLPVTQVAPFDVKTEYPASVAGMPMATYLDWMRSCWYVTFMACPAISVPAGFSASGLPVGLQIVGRHRGDWSVLQLAYEFEQATRHGARRPNL
jgi:amidase